MGVKVPTLPGATTHIRYAGDVRKLREIEVRMRVGTSLLERARQLLNCIAVVLNKRGMLNAARWPVAHDIGAQTARRAQRSGVLAMRQAPGGAGSASG